MIVTAFAEGDRKYLKNLLNREVYDGFVAAIGQRETRQEKIEFKFVGIDKADITEASQKNTTAQIPCVPVEADFGDPRQGWQGRRRRPRPCWRRDRHLDIRARGHLPRPQLEAGRDQIGRVARRPGPAVPMPDPRPASTWARRLAVRATTITPLLSLLSAVARRSLHHPENTRLGVDAMLLARHLARAGELPEALPSAKRASS